MPWRSRWIAAIRSSRSAVSASRRSASSAASCLGAQVDRAEPLALVCGSAPAAPRYRPSSGSGARSLEAGLGERPPSGAQFERLGGCARRLLATRSRAATSALLGAAALLARLGQRARARRVASLVGLGQPLRRRPARRRPRARAVSAVRAASDEQRLALVLDRARGASASSPSRASASPRRSVSVAIWLPGVGRPLVPASGARPRSPPAGRLRISASRRQRLDRRARLGQSRRGPRSTCALRGRAARPVPAGRRPRQAPARACSSARARLSARLGARAGPAPRRGRCAWRRCGSPRARPRPAPRGPRRAAARACAAASRACRSASAASRSSASARSSAGRAASTVSLRAASISASSSARRLRLRQPLRGGARRVGARRHSRPSATGRPRG